MHSSKLLLCLAWLLALWPTAAPAQAVLTPAPAGMACAQNSILPALATGQFGWAQCDPNGRLYTSSVGFTPIGAYATPLSVTTTTSNALLPSGPSITVYNTGAVPAYVTFGQANTITATTADEVVPPGGGCGFSVYPNTYIAAITATSTTTLNVSGGTGGAMPCWGGTGSSGGGPTSNVTIVSPLGTNSIAASVAVNPATSSLWPIYSTTNTPITPGAATATNATALGGQYNTTLPIFTNGQQGLIPVDQNGALNTGFDGATFTPTSVTSATLIFSQDMTGYAGISVQVTSAGTTCTISYETSDDNTNWFATAGFSSAFGVNSTSVTTTTTTGLNTWPKRGRYFRARVSTYTSGTVTVVYSLHKGAPIFATGTVNVTGVATAANQPTNAAQGSTTAAQTGTLVQGAVTTTAPAYITAQTSPLSLATNGPLRVTDISQAGNSTYVEATLTGATDTTICGGITPINGFEIINNSTTEILYFRENAAATVAGAASAPIQVAAAYLSPKGYKPSGPLHVIATTTGHAVIERCF